MKRFVRGPEPAILSQKGPAWAADWERKRAANPSKPFRWPAVNKIPLNQHLLPQLKEQTQDHCSFCDQYPVSPPSKDTIEHFRPKSRFPAEAYAWANLYYCCDYCQRKGERYDEGLLRPDANDYEFQRYFRWDYTLGRIEVNERATPADQERARVTIELYGLNEGEHPSLRRRESRRRHREPDEPLDDFAYRHYLEP